MATYGEGDPTDNAQQFYEFLQSTDCVLTGLHYAVSFYLLSLIIHMIMCTCFQVFGLGNKTYEHYNDMGKYFDKRLEELGAERVYELGLGDDDGNLEEDFMRWRESFWPTVAEKLGWQASETGGSDRQFRLEIVEMTSELAVFNGEIGRIGSFDKQRPYVLGMVFMEK
jgi:NADPH-ferrihemoprotein reductase